MGNLLGAFGITPPENELLDYAVKALAAVPLHAPLKNGDRYLTTDYNVYFTIDWLTPDCFFEIMVDFSFRAGSGLRVVLSNYSDHRIIINHEMMGQYTTITFPVPPESYTLSEYRSALDAEALRFIDSLDHLLVSTSGS